MLDVKRHPNNPIVWSNRANPWEAEAAFNGCAVESGGRFHLVYRAESAPQHVGDAELRLSSVGYAASRDGRRFSGRRQLIRPEYDWERYGCEDPRLTKFRGKYYIFYTALSSFPFSPDGIRVGLAMTRDFRRVEKHPVTPFNAKAMALFPRTVGGKMAAILTANTDRPPSKIAIALFDKESDLWSADYWHDWYAHLDEHAVPLQRTANDQVELGCPPLLTDYGWLVIYSYIRNYFRGQRIFGIEAAMLDRDDPRRIICRTDRPFLIPEEDYELYGRVPNVVFPSGAVIRKGMVHLYYGAADTTCCLASFRLDDLFEEMRAASIKLQRAETNPLLEPIGNHAWEAKAVFNPGVVQAGGRIHLLYRSLAADDTSYIGYASTTDGTHLDERSSEPVYVPREKFEKKAAAGVGSGCEDPRLTLIDGRVYMTYTAYDGRNPPRIALTSIDQRDFLAKRWNWSRPQLISPPGVDDKDCAIFPRKIGGKYAVLHRLGKSVWIDFFKDLKFEGEEWLGGSILMSPRSGPWDSRKIGIGGPPIETKKGWLLLYHGISKREDRHYHVRAALLDLKNPRRVLARSKYPIFEPETPYEKNGLVANVVFPCGTAILGDDLYVYYGGADKIVGVATVKLPKMLDLLLGKVRKRPARDENC